MIYGYTIISSTSLIFLQIENFYKYLKITTINSFVYKYISQFLSKTNSSKLKSLKFLMHIFSNFPSRVEFILLKSSAILRVLLKNLYILLLKRFFFQMLLFLVWSLNFVLCYQLSLFLFLECLFLGLANFPPHPPPIRAFYFSQTSLLCCLLLSQLNFIPTKTQTLL